MRQDDRDHQFREFVAERSAGLLRLAYLVSADRAGAEDVLQNALVKAYLRWPQISAEPEAYQRMVANPFLAGLEEGSEDNTVQGPLRGL